MRKQLPAIITAAVLFGAATDVAHKLVQEPECKATTNSFCKQKTPMPVDAEHEVHDMTVPKLIVGYGDLVAGNAMVTAFGSRGTSDVGRLAR